MIICIDLMNAPTSKSARSEDGKLYVYFRPVAGLNDILNEFVLALSYCKRYRRILLVDRSVAYDIDLLSFFCIINTDVEVIHDPETIERIVGSRIMNRKIRYCRSRRQHVFTDSDETTRFELDREYPNVRVLSFIRGGGGCKSYGFFRTHVRLSDTVHKGFHKKRLRIKSGNGTPSKYATQI